MKRALFAVLALCLFLTGCTVESVQATPATPANQQQGTPKDEPCCDHHAPAGPAANATDVKTDAKSEGGCCADEKGAAAKTEAGCCADEKVATPAAKSECCAEKKDATTCVEGCGTECGDKAAKPAAKPAVTEPAAKPKQD
jgi:hypothetical protein